MNAAGPIKTIHEKIVFVKKAMKIVSFSMPRAKTKVVIHNAPHFGVPSNDKVAQKGCLQHNGDETECVTVTPSCWIPT